MSEPAALEFERLMARWREAAEDGNLKEALTFADEAVAFAAAAGDDALRRRAACNRAQILIELGEGDSVLGTLREILATSREPETSFWTAYNLVRTYDLKHEKRKAQFYLGTAKHHLAAVTNPRARFAARNLSGCMLLAESRFEEARAEFCGALDVGSTVVWEALVRDNLGYCCVVLGRLDEGLRHLYRSLRVLRRVSPSYARFPRLALSVAYLDLGRLERAARHGRAALTAADAEGDPETAKMALYMLGEIAKQAGDFSLARTYFGVLQVRYYPENARLADVLLTVDARHLVNLKAQQ